MMCIGYQSLQGIILSASLLYRDREVTKEEMQLRDKALEVAYTSVLLAQRLQKKYLDQIYMLGLSHTLGDFLAIQKQCDSDLPLGLIASLVARKWNFPEEICLILLRSQEPLKDKYKNNIAEKAALIHIAVKINEGTDETYIVRGLEAFGVSSEKSLELYQELKTVTDEGFQLTW